MLDNNCVFFAAKLHENFEFTHRHMKIFEVISPKVCKVYKVKRNLDVMKYGL
jgi:hypothetical protein